MRCWRYHVIQLLREAYETTNLILPDSLVDLSPDIASFNTWLDRQYQKTWIIHCAKPTKNAWHNVQYLGGYIKRPPISQSRLKHYSGSTVTFRFLNHRTEKHENFICSTEEFIDRFIRHIPDKHFRLIRYYGFLANRPEKNSSQKSMNY